MMHGQVISEALFTDGGPTIPLMDEANSGTTIT